MSLARRRAGLVLSAVSIMAALWWEQLRPAGSLECCDRNVEWQPTPAEITEICGYLDAEMGILKQQAASGWFLQQHERLVATGGDPSRLHAVSLGTQYGVEICAAKCRALLSGKVRKADALAPPSIHGPSAFVFSAYGSLGALIFRIDAEDEDAAYHALAAIVADRL